MDISEETVKSIVTNLVDKSIIDINNYVRFLYKSSLPESNCMLFALVAKNGHSLIISLDKDKVEYFVKNNL